MQTEIKTKLCCDLNAKRSVRIPSGYDYDYMQRSVQAQNKTQAKPAGAAATAYFGKRPIPTFSTESTKTPEYKKGDTVKLGNYRGCSEWIVLTQSKGYVLIISKFGLDTRCFGLGNWKNCEVHNWLNSTFLSEAFSEAELKKIAPCTVKPQKNRIYSQTDQGEKSNDKVFLLSVEEAERFFDSDAARECLPSEYAIRFGASRNADTNRCVWLLRTNGATEESVACVLSDGSINYGGYLKTYARTCIRPALWIKV